MKKLIYLTAAVALLFAACTKNEVPGGQEIAFQTASYATKAGINGTQFPTSESFGVYAWTEGADPYFMDNEVVSYRPDEKLWKTATTYFWPKTQTVDFFCFYPSKMAEIQVEPRKVTYNGYDVEAAATKESVLQDVMYADKAVAFADYPEKVPGSVSGYTGVPAIFRHALSKIQVDAVLTYNHKEEADGTVTDWTATINSATLSGFYKAGSCELTLDPQVEKGLVGWLRPENNVWSNDGTVIAEKNLVSDATPLSVSEPVNVVPEMFVLPQLLAAGQQKIVFNVTIKTTRNGVEVLSETFDVAADFLVDKVTSWQMNHFITYHVSVKPTRSSGQGDDPDKPVDPSDPDLKDAVIFFDPAVNGWDGVSVSTTINL